VSPRDPPLQLHHRFTHLVSAKEALLLVGDDDAYVLDVPVAEDVVRLLDGHHTATEIALALSAQHRPEIIHFVLLKLEREGMVEPVADPVPQPSNSPLLETSDPSVASLARAMREAWVSRGASAAVRVGMDQELAAGSALFLTDDYLVPDLLDLQAEEAGSRRPFLLACLGARRVWFGPWVHPGESACVSCLQERLRINLAARALLHLPPEVGSADGFHIEPLAQDIPWRAYLRLSEAVGEVGGAHDGRTSLIVISLDQRPSEEHAVSRLPHCSVCGDPTLGPPGEGFDLHPTQRLALSSSGFRSVEPDETLRRLSPLISPLTGVIRHVRKVPVEGAEIAHVYTANHAHCFNAASVKTLRADRRDHSGGKGMTDQEARVSAICESVERFSSVYRGGEPSQMARLSELGSQAIHPNDLLLFSDAQFKGRGAWNEQDPSGFQWVPDPYQDEPIEWSRAQSLATGEIRLVPSAAIYLGFTGDGDRFCKGDSNGLASGNCLEEAILQGFLELAERDSVALWWYNRAALPGVDLGSFHDPRVQQTAELYPGLGRSLWALDLTSDLGIPTYVGLSALLDGPSEDIIFGFGAHPDPEIALRRALSELNQMLPTIVRMPEERRRQLMPDFEHAIRWWENATLVQHPYLSPAPDLPFRTRTDFSQPGSRDLLEDVHECVARAGRAGCDVLVHDLTRPDVGFPVARVLVPGLRHFWRRLGPGRLYDVPVELGWLKEPRSEKTMNPISMFV
jgi:bacteriocin biosynthesis cyclodehydratase domain-containing protein